MSERVYRRRRPQQSELWKIINDHLETYLAEKGTTREEAKEKGEYYRYEVEEVLRKYLDCGNLAKGFARIKCEKCNKEYLLSFSCKGRWFCPSCHQKKVILFGEFMQEEVASYVPHRQYVFSLPIMLRHYFKHNKKLVSKLSRLAQESLEEYMRLVLKNPEGKIGMVVVIQTFGEYLNYHPHLHTIVADGLFLEDGSFYVMPQKDKKKLEQLFRLKVMRLLVGEGHLTREMANKLLKWRHSGFSVYQGGRIRRENKEALERLAQYVIRNPVHEEKIIYEAHTATVIYRSKYNQKIKGNFKVFKAHEFIEELSMHIPSKGSQMVRYYGYYSNKKRGMRKKTENTANEPNIKEAVGRRRVPAKKWRELIKKVWEVDPLICPYCKSNMRIISLIDDVAVIKKILTHLELSQDNDTQRSPPDNVP